MSWRDELLEAVKTKKEREAEKAERLRERVAVALVIAEEAYALVREVLGFGHEQMLGKGQKASFESTDSGCELRLDDFAIVASLSNEDAQLNVSYNKARPRSFDFLNDRHLSPKDVEEYVGRRTVELVRAAQQKAPW